MIGAPQQNWRQIMQMPQQWNAPSGLGFPTQGAMGGWMMPRQQATTAAPASAAAPSAPAPSPMNPGESQFDFLSRMSLVDPANYASKLYEYQIQNPNWHNMGAPMMGAYGVGGLGGGLAGSLGGLADVGMAGLGAGGQMGAAGSSDGMGWW